MKRLRKCHFGKLHRSFLACKAEASDWCYITKDLKGNPNANGKLVSSALAPLIVVNGLKMEYCQFDSRATYRMGQIWKSELDYCLVTPTLAQCVKNFSIDWQTKLPSNNALIAVTFDRKSLSLAEGIGQSHDDRVLELGKIDYSTPRSKKPQHCQINMDQIDDTKFVQFLRTTPPLFRDLSEPLNVHELSHQFNQTM